MGSITACFHFIRGTDFASGDLFGEVIALVALSGMYGSMIGIPLGIIVGAILAIQPTLGSLYVTLYFLTVPGLVLGALFALISPGNYIVTVIATAIGCAFGYSADSLMNCTRNQRQ